MIPYSVVNAITYDSYDHDDASLTSFDRISCLDLADAVRGRMTRFKDNPDSASFDTL